MIDHYGRLCYIIDVDRGGHSFLRIDDHYGQIIISLLRNKFLFINLSADH